MFVLLSARADQRENWIFLEIQGICMRSVHFRKEVGGVFYANEAPQKRGREEVCGECLLLTGVLPAGCESNTASLSALMMSPSKKQCIQTHREPSYTYMHFIHSHTLPPGFFFFIAD